MNSFGKALEKIYGLTIGLFLLISWLMGIVISGSWWSIILIYAWYVLIEKIMQFYHILGYTA